MVKHLRVPIACLCKEQLHSILSQENMYTSLQVRTDENSTIGLLLRARVIKDPKKLIQPLHAIVKGRLQDYAGAG